MGYKPISDYGIIGNMLSAALIGVDGSIDWCCLPGSIPPASLPQYWMTRRAVSSNRSHFEIALSSLAEIEEK